MKPERDDRLLEEIAAYQTQCIVGLVHLKRKREREGPGSRHRVAILADGIAAALYAWDPVLPPTVH